MKVCPSCGTQNADENLFCTNCRYQFPVKDEGGVGALPPGPIELGAAAAHTPASAEAAANKPEPPAEEATPPVQPAQEQAVVSPVPPVVGPPPMPGSTVPHAGYTQPHSPIGMISMILGICSIGLCVCWPITWMIAIAGIVTGVIGLKNPNTSRGMATAGLITGIFGLLLGLLMIGFVIYAMIHGGSDPFAVPGAPR